MSDSIRLTDHFTLYELCKSELANKNNIDNTPDEEQLANLKTLCTKVLEPLRISLGRHISVLSGFRSHALNDAVRGAVVSQHLTGCAADIIASGMKPVDLFDFIRNSPIGYDQLILEFDKWVHISYNSKTLRHERLIASRGLDGRTIYRDWT